MEIELHGHIENNWLLCSLAFGWHVLLIADQSFSDCSSQLLGRKAEGA